MEILSEIFMWLFLFSIIALIVFAILWFKNRKDSESKSYKSNKLWTLISLGVVIITFIGYQVTPTDDDVKATPEQTSKKVQSASSSKSESKSSESKKPENYEETNYDTLARTPQQMKGKAITFTGDVTDVEKKSNGYELVMCMNGDADQNMLVFVNKSDLPENGNILKGDLITVKGISQGRKSYDSLLGGEQTVPYVRTSDKVVDQGKAPEDYGDEE